MTRGLFAYDPAGRVFVIACGSELLAHDGDSEAPLWKKQLDDQIVGIDLAGDEIVALLTSGVVVRYVLKIGREIGRADLGKPAVSLSVSNSGWVAAAHPEGVSLLRRGDFSATTIDENGVTALAWSGDGTKLLLAAPDVLIELDRPERGDPGRRVTLAGTPTALAWSPRGAWLVAIDARVVRLEPGAADAMHVTRLPAEKRVTDVAVSLDGSRFALQMDETDVMVLADPPKDTLASLNYPDRKVQGIRFGPGTWLGIALDTGDGNKLDYATGTLHRSDTHPGRTHTRWLVAVSAGPTKKKSPAAKTKKSAPAAPVARRPPADLSYDPPPPADEGPSIITILRIIVAIVALVAALARCH